MSEKTMECPTNYGWFHIMFLFIIAIGTILICRYFKDCNDKIFNKIVFIFWIVAFLLEIYKQIEYSFTYEDDIVTWDYQFYAFPFQFCSSQLYILPFIFILKDGKIRDAMISFIMTFSLFAGLAVCFYPNDVFVETIFINFQTMIHHGTQVLLGIFMFVRFRKQVDIKYFIKGIYVFVSMLVVAIVLNIVVHKALVAVGNDETFNMFFISPYEECTLPILSMIDDKVPYIVFFLIYTLGFVFVSYIMYILETSIYKLVIKKKYEKETV